MSSIIDSFKDFLVNKGYPKENLVHFTVNSRGCSFDGIKVFDKNNANGRVIQAFALMSETMRKMHHVYPFYRTTKWGENNGTLFPSCSVATRNEDNTWSVFDAHETKMLRDASSYIDFEKAILRFDKRLNAEPAVELRKKTRLFSWSSAGIILSYFVLSVACPLLQLPFGYDVVCLFLLVVALVLLPILIPFIRSIRIFGFDVIFGRE